MKPQLLVACDFDGTVTRQDTLVEILNRFGSPTWHDVQTKVVSGEISIREGLRAEMRSVKASLDEIQAILCDRVEVDPTFPSFLKQMRSGGVPVICLSGGFDVCVETVMTQAGLWPIPYLANRLVPQNGTGHWDVEFPYPSVRCLACGHCKGDPIRSWNDQGYTTVFVGNSVTDRCGAQAASLTFAKDELGHWCETYGIPHVAFDSFNDVREELARRGWI